MFTYQNIALNWRGIPHVSKDLPAPCRKLQEVSPLNVCRKLLKAILQSVLKRWLGFWQSFGRIFQYVILVYDCLCPANQIWETLGGWKWQPQWPTVVPGSQWVNPISVERRWPWNAHSVDVEMDVDGLPNHDNNSQSIAINSRYGMLTHAV